MRHSVECGPMPNVMAALEIKVAPSVENDEERRQVWLTPPARVPCSNAANMAPYCENMWRRYCCLTSFFPIVETCLSCEDKARQICAMVPRWRTFGDFFASCISAGHLQHISDLNSNFALGPRHVWKYGRHPISDR